MLLFYFSLGKINLRLNASWSENATTVAGWTNGTAGSSASQLEHPFGLSITSDDKLYICDRSNNRTVRVTLNSSQNIFTIGPGSAPGMFNTPHDIFNIKTSIYVLDTNNHRVQNLSLDVSNATTVLNYSRDYVSYFFYVDDDANIYLSVSDMHKVVLYHSNWTNETTVAGNGSEGSNTNQLRRPYGVFADSNGTLYVADRNNHRIMRWTRNAFSGICVAGNGTRGNSAAQLNEPVYVIVDTHGYMYITEDQNHRVTRWGPNSTVGECIAACTGNEGTAANQLKNPQSLAFDSYGSLYVSEWSNHRVQKFQITPDHSEYLIYS